MTARPWTATAERLPPEGVVVEVQFDKNQSSRIVKAYLDKWGWWTEDRKMLRFTPIAWCGLS